LTIRKLLLAAFSAAPIAECTVTAQDLDGTLKKIKDSSTLNLGYRESAPPFSFPGPDRRPVGYSVDLCTHVASAIQKQLGTNLKLN
jgi:glutamate/aspartate transport system substrate-binding protein